MQVAKSRPRPMKKMSLAFANLEANHCRRSLSSRIRWIFSGRVFSSLTSAEACFYLGEMYENGYGTVLDLDTVMPGSLLFDFGDAIRFAANFVEEDCPQVEKAGIDLNVFWAFAEGFLKKTASTLTESEIDTLALSCFSLACELSTRFLADYIMGDKYFNIRRNKHNLERTRCQIALAKDMMEKMNAMNAIVRECAERNR